MDNDSMISASESPNPEIDPPKGRKRRRNHQNWENEKKKRARVEGTKTATYKTKKNPVEKTVEPRVQVKDFDCQCKCSTKFTAVEKDEIFQKYSSFKSWSEQTLYLQSLCKSAPVARHRKRVLEGGRNRSIGFTYHLEVKRNRKMVSVVVCQKAFLSLLGIDRTRIRRKVQKKVGGHEDGRGRHKNRPLMIPEDRLEEVRSFISNLPARESHYSRKDNKRRKYLDSSLTIKMLHDEFIRGHPQCKGVIKYPKFYDIFVHDFNIGFGYPRSDLCDTCELLKAKMDKAKEVGNKQLEKDLATKKELHLCRAEAFFAKMKEVKKDVAEDPTKAALCFDYEKNFPLPVTGSGPEYYKRQLWLQNFGVHNIGSGNAHMFVYAEHFAAKGPNEVISMLHWYFSTVLAPEVKEVFLFCDNCAAQNKNRFLWAYLQSLVDCGRFTFISVLYPIPGHSFMPCDRDFALIEKKRKKLDKVIAPSQWVDLIKSSRPSQPFEIVFVQYPLTDNLVSDGTPIVKVSDYKAAMAPVITAVKEMMSLKGIVISKDGMKVRKLMNGDPNIDVKIRKRGITIASFKNAISSAGPAYSDFLPLKDKKYVNVMSLLERIALPPGLTFYSSLSANGNDGNSSGSEEFD